MYVLFSFDDCNSLGFFSHTATLPAAGCPEVNEVNDANFCGYRLKVIDCSPSPGVHFVFEYIAQEIGETDLKIYDAQRTTVLDSIHIVVVPPPNPGTAFTYQGRLIDDNKTAYGLYDFQFKLYNAPQASAQQGNTVDLNDVEVVDGIFTAELDFGINVFIGEARWLEIAVRPGDSSDPFDFVTLSPRQEITPTPYAIHAEKAGELTDSNSVLPRGVIVMWSGSIASIPSGWALCNGSNGTPDLRDRFIVGAGTSYGVGSTGGSTQHNHGGNTAGHTLTIAEMPSHHHQYNGGDIYGEDGSDYPIWRRQLLLNTTDVGGDQPHSHGISYANHLPPYYALAYIMKL